MSISRYHKQTDIKQTLHLSINLLDVVNFYVIVIDSLSEQVKKLAIKAEAGFNAEDISQIDDYTVEVRILRSEIPDWEFGNYHFQLRASYTNAGYEDSVRIDSNSKTAFRIVKDNIPTVNEIDIVASLPYTGPPANGITKFTELIDTPSDLTNDSLKLVRVTANEAALEFTDTPIVNEMNYNLSHTPAVESEGTTWWNPNDKTLNIATGLGPVIQVGQEFFYRVQNSTGDVLLNGKVVYATGTVTNGLPDVQYTQANSWETCYGTIGIITATIANGESGLATIQGVVRNIDTSLLSVGFVYLDANIAGALTNTPPSFPNYTLPIGGVIVSDDTVGELVVAASGSIHDTVEHAWDGSVRETFAFTVDSSGTVVTGTLKGKDNTKNLTLMFSDGFYTLDTTTSPLTLVLTPGTNTNPQANFVFIDKATKTLQTSTGDWPVDEHTKIAYVFLRSALSTQTEDAFVNQNWNDHIKETGDNGHLLHMSERMRQEPAKWHSGVLGSSTITGTPSEVYAASTAGKVYQLHRQDFPVLNSQTGSLIHVVNHNTTPFVAITNLATQTLDANGVTLANSSFSFVLWGIQNKSGEASHLMVNLPIGKYAKNDQASAVSDPLNYSIYDIPNEFKSVGFLIARFTYTLDAAGTTWVLYDTQDLRGFQPSNAAGGAGGAGGVTEWTALTDTPSSYASQARKIPVVNVGETALEFTNSPSFNTLAATGLSVYANNAAALSGGLSAGDFYKTASTGDAQLMVVNAT